ncbi:YybH family protein [Paenibacillus sacheonensis]|uniref:SnoaL-like domain-containing protein n=1 Tax=Paenibacillus sacheonensis TaxID=742054 RepID=A0A7X4YJZ7_9BACL|nr:nuclear transport factor 2 family protein [Paenibacillus sacheonensis]MBM7563983.1 ketosteroid isomerase-like protein [Paenibacillus sacheonensis]NBC67677.1 hypothetical protein [Paenibacillus sacheonensis]
MSVGFQTVQDALENYKSAIYEQDAARFLATFAADIHIYDCWESWACTGISAWKEIVAAWFAGLREEGVVLRTDFADLVVESNANLAFVRCAITFAAYNKSGEKLREITNRFTFGLRNEQESWVIAHAHSSLPISLETGKGLFDVR